MSNDNIVLKITARFLWSEILEIKKSKFDEYKSKGIPSADKNAVAYEKFMEKLETDSESSGSMLYEETANFKVITNDNKENDMKGLFYDPNITTNLPLQRINTEISKLYLIRTQVTDFATYKISINNQFNTSKLKIVIHPEELPGGRIFNSLIVKYDDSFFDYGSGYSNYDSSHTYLVDRNGNQISIEGNDNLNPIPNSLRSNKLSKDNNALQKLTNWFPSNINPIREGQYDVETLEKVVWPNFPITRALWNGKNWEVEDGKAIAIKSWRGLI